MKYIVANWKMNLTYKEGLNLLHNIENKEWETDNTIIICPPTIWASEVSAKINKTFNPSFNKVKVGVQNISDKDNGAYTGEISASIVKSFGIDYAIIGHSERRDLFAENNQITGLKTKKAIDNEITPIVCIGETKEQRENKQHEIIVEEQLKSLFTFLSEENKIIIAYEPIWAIGSGLTPGKEQIEAMHSKIKSLANSFFSHKKTRILYGGSVKPDNISVISKIKNVDGFLIGNSSLSANDFYNLILTFS